MRISQIEKIASNILSKFKVNEMPIPIEGMVKKIGLNLIPYNLGDKVSGVLVIKKGEGTIGYNSYDAKARQRFTIAHELGHYILHRTTSDLFVDKEYKVLFRNQKSSSGEIRQEQEANAFAAALLMPRDLVIKEIQKSDIDLTNEEAIKSLAETFNVSTMAMTFRISNLNLF